MYKNILAVCMFVLFSFMHTNAYCESSNVTEKWIANKSVSEYTELCINTSQGSFIFIKFSAVNKGNIIQLMIYDKFQNMTIPARCDQKRDN